MSYQVLARKWRPRNFSQMVGQEHVLRALINALDNDRVHHAFLFTGTRGVGKTTIARILAKSLNCEVKMSSTPCGVCNACREIDEGRFIDLLELDAASHTGIDNMREVLDNAQYAPTRGRYKVYLIDEVHMLSKPAFNSMLKTLEEPPPHVKFILATTDPQKIPVTVLSRCLQFSLKRLPVELIDQHLAFILGEEGIANEAGALLSIARAADGSMRDALSLLDQAIGHGGGSVQEVEVRAMLGSIGQEQVLGLLEALAKHDAVAVLALIQVLSEQAADFAGVLVELIATLHRIALAQAAPQQVDDSLGDAGEIMKLAALLSPEDAQLFYQIAVIGRRDLHLIPDPRSAFEMVLLRMLTFRPVTITQAPVTQKSGLAPTKSQTAASESSAMPAVSAGAGSQFKAAAGVTRPLASPNRGNSPGYPAVESRRLDEQPAPAKKAVPEAHTDEKPDSGTVPATRTAPLQDNAESWTSIVSALKLSGLTNQLALNCELTQRSADSIHLLLDSPHAHLRSKANEDRLSQALQNHYAAPIKLIISTGAPLQETPALQASREQAERQRAAVLAIQNDANVQAFRDTFSASVDVDSIQALD